MGNETDPKLRPQGILEKIPGGPTQLIIVSTAVAAGLIIGGIPGVVTAVTIAGADLAVLLIRPKPPIK